MGNAAKPPAVIVDIDGTLASNTWRLHHIRDGRKDWKRFFAEMDRDAPVGPLVDLVRWLAHEVEIVVMSGRPADHEGTIRRWLAEHQVVYDQLHLRPAGDYRPDTVVKRELYRDRVAADWDVVLAIDDREQVIDMWRAEGLYVLAVVDPGLDPLSGP